MSGDRARTVVIAVVVVLSSVAVVAVSAGPTLIPQQGTVALQTDSGLTVRVTEPVGITDNPFAGSDNQSISRGNVTISSTGNSSVTLDALPSESGDGEVILSELSAGSGRLDVATPGQREVGLAEGATAAQLVVDRSVDLTDTTDTVDARVSSPDGTTIQVNGAGVDVGVLAVDADSGAPLDSGTRQPDGSRTFEIPDGTHEIAFQQGPSTLFVFNESEPSQTVTDDTGLRVRFVPLDGEGTNVTQRNVTDGTVSLADLPFTADRPLVVTVGDSFGTGSVTVNLERQERYRLRLVSTESGEERVLGSFTPLTRTQTEELIVSQVALNPETSDTGVGFTGSFNEVDNSTRLLRALFQDPTNQTTSLEYKITRVDTDPNQTVVATTREDGPLGRIVLTEPVTTNESAEFLVEFEYLRGGELQTGTVRLGGVRPLGLPGDPQVLSLLSWVGLIATTGLVVIRSPRVAALVAAIGASGLSVFGLISVPPVALGISGAIALLMFVSRGVS